MRKREEFMKRGFHNSPSVQASKRKKTLYGGGKQGNCTKAPGMKGPRREREGGVRMYGEEPSKRIEPEKIATGALSLGKPEEEGRRGKAA